MMNILERETIKSYHRTRLAIHSNNQAMAQGWKNSNAQKKRFECFLKLANFNAKKVLDVGCGCGDFKSFLDSSCEHFTYIGLDQQPEFIQIARDRNQFCENTWFYEVDCYKCEFPSIDILVASGFFSYFKKESSYFLAILNRFYKTVNECVIFNMLNQDVFNTESIVTAHNKNEIYQLCQSITHKVELFATEGSDFFTIKLSK